MQNRLTGDRKSITRLPLYRPGRLALALSMVLCLGLPVGAQGLVFKTFLEAGDACASQGRYSEAEKNYRACLNELSGANAAAGASGLKNKRDMLLKLAHAQAAQGKYGAAGETLQKSQELLGKDASALEVSQGLCELAQMQRLEGKSKDSLATYISARDMMRTALSRAKSTDRSSLSDALSVSLLGISAACQELGLSDQAEEALKQNIAIYDQSTDTGALCRAMEALARLRVRQDRLTEAESLLTKVLDIRVSRSGESFDLIDTLVPLARVDFMQEKMEDGEALLKRAMTICNSLDATKSSSRSVQLGLGTVLDAMSEHYCDMGAYKKALATASRQVELKQSLYGPSHPKVADALARLADIQYNAKEFDKAQSNYKKAIELTEDAYGKDAAEVARYLNELGLVYLSLGKYDDAGVAYQKALSIVEAAKGSDHLDVATCLNNLALLKLNTGQLTEAQTLTERGLAIRRKALGSESPVVARNLVNLSNILIAQKKYDEAESSLKEALKIQNAVYLQPTHSEKIETMLQLGKVYLDSSKYEDAQKYIDLVLKGDQANYGAKSPPVASDLELLVKIANAQKHCDDAKSYGDQLREIKLALLSGSGAQGVPDSDAVAGVSGADTASDASSRPAGKSSGKKSESMKRPVRDKWALVIGISSFKDSSINLKYAAKDATDFKNYLVNDAGFKSDHVRLLTNDQATRENIVGDLGDRWLARRAHPDDLVVVYISSHGSPSKKEINANFILPYEGNIHNIVLTGIPMQWFTVGVKDVVKADRTLLVLDVCHGGAAAEEGEIASGGKSVSRHAITGIDFHALDIGEGQLVLASSLSNQLSWESINYPNSVFTRKLIEGLKLRGKQTGINEAFNYMKTQVEDEVLRDRGELQAPVLRNSGWTGGDLSIACPVIADSLHFEDVSDDKQAATASGAQTAQAKGLGNKSSTGKTNSNQSRAGALSPRSKGILPPKNQAKKQ